MRKKFNEIVKKVFYENKKVFLFLGDIGVYGFRDLLANDSARAKNFGILEQAMIGAAAGVASEGFIPIVHTIAPFMIERAYEQIKVDLSYQKLSANLISVGGSYDYSALGCTHHCPADISLMYNIPNCSIFIPGNPNELERLFLKHYATGLNYFRLSEDSHSSCIKYDGFSKIFNSPNSETAIIFVGPTLRFWEQERRPLPHNIWYLNMISESVNFSLPKDITNCIVIQRFL